MAGNPLTATHDSFLLVGGPAHGEMASVTVGAATWVHLGSGSTYRRVKFGTFKRGPLGVPSKVYEREFFVHESIRDQNRANLLLQLAALHRWFMGGIPRDLTEAERGAYKDQNADRSAIAKARLNGGSPTPDPTGHILLPGDD